MSTHPSANKALLDRVTELQEDLKFVERWAVHHGTKSHMTPENALSIIQHYPAITAITKSYADGKVPDTFNPFARIAELEAQLAASAWQPIETAPKDDDALILVANDEGVWVAKYRPVYQSGFKPSNPWSSMLLNHDHIRFHKSHTPTHWIPLPKPPAIKGEQAA